MRLNLISLFAGAGGLDLGLEFAGFKTLVANELAPEACETLRKNQLLSSLSGKGLEKFIEDASKQRCFMQLNQTELKMFFSRLQDNRIPCLQEAKILEGDIRSISSDVFKKAAKNEEIFVIAGGPPCQPFSKAGKRKTFDCSKNGDLFYEFVRIVRDLKPRWFIFENVKGLEFTKTDVVYSICKNCNTKAIADFRLRQNWDCENFRSFPCSKCGNKNTHLEVINESGGSLKIIESEFKKVGYMCFARTLNAADFGAPQIRERLFIVGSRDGKNFEWPQPTHQSLNENTHAVQQDFFIEKFLPPWRTMREVLWSQGHWHYKNYNHDTAVLWVKNVVRPHDEPVTWSLDRPSPTIGAHQGAKLAFAPHGVPKEQIFRQQWHTLGRRQGDTPPVFVEHQYLSDEELLKLQTFPRWWYLHGTRMQRVFQIGNAVPPVLAKVIGEAIKKADSTA
ncbi:DNA (cytosine-5)-methyltransferase 1 [Allochromatium warmingii]|uniref:DNA (cytosine-5-)-methyltransferase n=1 Tax=Allochromatium warmingii TaxID=61595 RepID=A0A1H3F827_ALLWA|nr:DNA cytosine methyltransferase [Allochromatium warmingii]SDX87007.1 DNA (cytosine-5)-methyltransferase 1 [Allochromatium warmingii]